MRGLFPEARSSRDLVRLAAAAALLLFAGPVRAHEGHSKIGPKPVESADHQEPAKEAGWEDIGVDEKLGQKVPASAVFRDEYGNKTSLSLLINRPTLILPVYYSCPQACATELSNLAAALEKVPLKIGEDYGVLSLSIDRDETPETALETKRTYVKRLSKEPGDDDWKFLTGDSAAIRNFADAIGFRFQETAPHEFIHPNVLIALSRDGTIIRYLYGPDFLPFDMGMALTEATKGTPSLSVRKMLSYCFAYDPGRKSYAFKAIQFIGLGIVLLIFAGLFILLRKPKPKDKE